MSIEKNFFSDGNDAENKIDGLIFRTAKILRRIVPPPAGLRCFFLIWSKTEDRKFLITFRIRLSLQNWRYVFLTQKSEWNQAFARG